MGNVEIGAEALMTEYEREVARLTRDLVLARAQVGVLQERLAEALNNQNSEEVGHGSDELSE